MPNSNGFVVDKLQIKGHISKRCKKFCHPDNFPQLMLLNIVVCEQKNFWLVKYKYSLKHMGINRFNFFVFIKCGAYNQLNIDNKLGFIVNNDISEKSERLKRKLDEISFHVFKPLIFLIDPFLSPFFIFLRIIWRLLNLCVRHSAFMHF